MVRFCLTTKHPPIATAEASSTMTTELSQRPNSNSFQRALTQTTSTTAIIVPIAIR